MGSRQRIPDPGKTDHRHVDSSSTVKTPRAHASQHRHTVSLLIDPSFDPSHTLFTMTMTTTTPKPIHFIIVTLLVAASCFATTCHTFAFAPSSRSIRSAAIMRVVDPRSPRTVSFLAATPQGDNDTDDSSPSDESLSTTTTSTAAAKISLEDKMKAWEATEQEIKAATLGGIVPKSGGGEEGGRSDAFDVGLYILFPFMVLSGLAFAFFPFIMGNLDLDGIGPPPTM